MERLLLPSIFVQRIETNNHLAQCRFLVASAVLLLSGASFAAIPLNDNELTNNFLSNDIASPQLASIQLLQNDTALQQLEDKQREAEQQLQDIAAQNPIENPADPAIAPSITMAPAISPEPEPEEIGRIKQAFADLVQASNISNVTVTLSNKERKKTLTSSDPLLAFDILNEIALNDTKSENYFWNGKFNQTYDLSAITGIYFDTNTGSYELSNIRGIVEIQAVSYDDDRGSKFRRANYVFN